MLTSVLLLACSPADSPEFSTPPKAVFEQEGLTSLAQDAVGLAPDWIKPDLSLAFHRMSDEHQDRYAVLLVDLDEPWLSDEIAFVIAHTSLDVLTSSDFYPELILDNAQWVYEVEPALRYVEIVDVGEPGVDPNFYSTARYQVQVDGALETVEIDRDIYYWFVVHPRIEDEGPYYIDAWATCMLSSLECPTSTEAGGMFWREFLWEAAETTCPEGDYCPVLRDTFDSDDVEFLWSDTGGGVGAVGAVANFMLMADTEAGRWLTFGAQGERSIQPNRIYALGRGNCGEWGDMTSALSRTVLLPNYNTTPASWDHTWNEFYDPSADRWVAWEPVNRWFDHDYGARTNNYGTRGDTQTFGLTQNYSSDTFTLSIEAAGADGTPADGHRLMLYSRWPAMGDGLYWSGEVTTDVHGRAEIELVAGEEFYYQFSGELGAATDESSVDLVTRSADVAERVELSIALDGVLPEAVETKIGSYPAPNSRALLQLTGKVDSGRVLARSYRYDADFTLATDPPPVRWMLMSETEYAVWASGTTAEVVAQGVLGEPIDDIALGAREIWFLVVVNESSTSTAALGELGLVLSPTGGSTWTEPVTLDVPLTLLPGEHQKIEIEVLR